MQAFSFRNVLASTLRPQRLRVMAGKVFKRLRDERGGLDAVANMAWIKA